jgi:hypothetical protein
MYVCMYINSPVRAWQYQSSNAYKAVFDSNILCHIQTDRPKSRVPVHSPSFHFCTRRYRACCSCVYMYVCMYVYTYVCVYVVFISAADDTVLAVAAYTCMYVCVCVCMSICTYMYMCLHVHICYMYVYVCVFAGRVHT